MATTHYSDTRRVSIQPGLVMTPTSTAISPGESTNLPDYETPKPKRRKIKLACRACRKRKTRCDGTLPVCRACTGRGVGSTCVYVNVADDEIINIDDPASQSRPVRAKSYTAQPSNPSFTPDTKSNGSPQIPSDPVRPVEHNGQLPYAPRLPRHDDAHQVDALATVTTTSEDLLVYGGSSTIAFVRSFTHGTNERSNESSTTDQATRPSGPSGHRFQADRPITAQPVPMLERDARAFLLPPRKTANEYVQCFWEFIHPLFPVLHKTSFMEKYAQLWSSEDAKGMDGDLSDVNEVIFASTLNLIFSIGCQFSHSVAPQHKVAIADDFYQRSRKIFVYDMLDSISVSLVQMLVLTGVYLQSTQYASRCWNVIGLAIRTAQSLGLHLDMTKTRSESQVNREMRRRIWHSCVVMDKLVSMTFGRPTMVSKNWDVPLPALIDDEYLRSHGEGEQPSHIPSRLALLISSSKLFSILDEILNFFYAEHLGNDLEEKAEDEVRVREMISKVLVLNRRLEEFADNVPDYVRGAILACRAPKEQNTSVQIQEQVLYCRFLYTRVLLLRPLLLVATKRRSTVEPAALKPSSLDVDIVKSCCNLCIKTAQYLIECLHQHLDTTYRSSGWHSVYFTFAAATILLAGLNCPLVDEDIIMPSFEINWHRCLSIMEHYKQQIQSAPRAIQVLKSLREQLAGSRSQPLQPTSFSLDPMQVNNHTYMDFSQFNPHGTDFLDDAWYSQHLVNLDWLELC
ncbi:hypothetical protein B0A52_03995 [Exophiala mesophila]|uniref:Zn(2)-C6 fungal-type domain-containing protein n=1 Tax=Exophiala mesophila TaxID=212818 RepID=A0A438NA15_EXOME|nr:hypothetical protein B0A52_03995 [Exophiala mesophila]